jgi:hypothetical protein
LLFLNSLSVSPLILAINSKFSSTVSSSIMVSCWLSRPIYLPTNDMLMSRMFWSKIAISPLVTGISIEIIFRVVVLPEPLGPNRPTISPCLTPSEFLQTAINPLSWTFFTLAVRIYQLPLLSSFSCLFTSEFNSISGC